MGRNNTPDEILVDKIILGDKKSEDVLYNRYRSIITNHLNYEWRNHIPHDDNVSEILIKIFNKLTNYNHKMGSFHSWVFKITKNHMYDLLRKLSVRPIKYYDFNNIDDYDYFATQTIDVVFDYDEQTKTAIDKLSVFDKELLNMKYVEGYSYADIGNYFNMSSTTASNKVNYIKAKIKKEIC
jgi:RNA polymerase sigma factor (sigma-70 family)